ncbi:hypothetical protein HPB48_021770 [Haemaphysalis longicornis]|uniref:Ionotropic receptor n=1 Tax=Haemaphysalis longicornis TaxID=44386 RepID=A0A9J6G800_HAELO|nr:hypothetical protein HPB48_021770 [Haemaphysalis longicornis]
MAFFQFFISVLGATLMAVELTQESSHSDIIGRAITQTVWEKWRPITVVVIANRRRVQPEKLLAIRDLLTPTVYTDGSPSQLHNFLRNQSPRGDHTAVLFFGHTPKITFFTSLERDSYYRPHITLVHIGPRCTADVSCAHMRRFRISSVVVKGEKWMSCRYQKTRPGKDWWSGLRERAFSILCGPAMWLCKNRLSKVTLDALKILNASVTFESVDRTEGIPSEKIFWHEELSDKDPYWYRISPDLLRGDVIFYGHHSLADAGKPAGSTFAAQILLFVLCVSVAVILFSVISAAIATLTTFFLPEPTSGILELFLSLAVAKSYQVKDNQLASYARRVLFSFWALACVCIVVYVQSALTSSIIVPPEKSAEFTFEAFCKAIRENDVCLWGDEIALKNLLTAPLGENAEKVRNHLEDPRSRCHTQLSTEDCEAKAANATHVAVMVKGNTQDTCSVGIDGKLVFGNTMLGSVFRAPCLRKGFPYSEPLNSLVQRLIETGILYRPSSMHSKPCSRVLHSEESLPWNVPFITSALGCSLAVLVFLCEIAHARKTMMRLTVSPP